MRYNPRTDEALSIDEIAKQCMDAVKRSTSNPYDDILEQLFKISHGLQHLMNSQGRAPNWKLGVLADMTYELVHQLETKQGTNEYLPLYINYPA